jgi:hypothetical protein
VNWQADAAPVDLVMLNPESRYAKSTKGRDEVAKSGGSLSLALRSVLIVIDGKTAMRDLLVRYASIPTFERDVTVLLSEGYIGAVDDEAKPDKKHREPPSDSEADGGPKEELIAIAVRLLAEHARSVVARLEKSGDRPEELLASLEGCCKLIKLTIDEKKAERFRELGQRILADHA